MRKILILGSFLLAIILITMPVCHADSVFVLGGAKANVPLPSKDLAHIGTGWYTLPQAIPEVVDYNRSPLFDVNGHTVEGQQNLDAAIRAAYAADPSAQIIVVSHSMGTIASQKEEAVLTGIPRDQVKFIEISSPTRPMGASMYFPTGVRIPIIGWTREPIAESPYDVDVIVGQYDGFSDAPDRPRNIVADVNAIMGIATVHWPVTQSNRADGMKISESTNSVGGTTTVYVVPTDKLPILAPLRSAGVPEQIVSRIEVPLKRLIDKGYSRNDSPVDARSTDRRIGVRNPLSVMGNTDRRSKLNGLGFGHGRIKQVGDTRSPHSGLRSPRWSASRNGERSAA